MPQPPEPFPTLDARQEFRHCRRTDRVPRLKKTPCQPRAHRGLDSRDLLKECIDLDPPSQARWVYTSESYRTTLGESQPETLKTLDGPDCLL